MRVDFARGGHLGILVFCLSALAIALVVAVPCGWLDPLKGLLTACAFRVGTDQPCPLCGTTTAATLLFRGDVRASLSTNPLAAGLLPLGATQIAYRSWRVARPVFDLREELLVDAVGLACLVGIVGWWAL